LDRLKAWNETELSVGAVRRVLAELQAPLPATRIPPLTVVTVAHLAKLVLGEVIQEAMRIQTMTRQQQRGEDPAANSRFTSSNAPLDPASIQLAYQNLAASGRILSRVARPGFSVPVTQLPADGAPAGAALDDSDMPDTLMAARPRRPRAWKR